MVKVAKGARRFHPMTPEALALVAERFRVLAEPLRLRLLQRLMHGEHNVNQLAQSLKTSQPNVSKHLRVLQEAGLVARRQEKNTALYSLADASVFELCDVVCNSLQRQYRARAQAFVV